MDILEAHQKALSDNPDLKNELGKSSSNNSQIRAIALAVKPQIEEAVTQGVIEATDVASVVALPWKQPTGSTDAYELGAIVSHNGKNWRSNVPANVWEPGATGIRQWDLVA